MRPAEFRQMPANMGRVRRRRVEWEDVLRANDDKHLPEHRDLFPSKYGPRRGGALGHCSLQICPRTRDRVARDGKDRYPNHVEKSLAWQDRERDRSSFDDILPS